MVKNSNMVVVLVTALKNFYEQKGDARDLLMYKGHSKLTKTFVRLKNLSKKCVVYTS